MGDNDSDEDSETELLDNRDKSPNDSNAEGVKHFRPRRKLLGTPALTSTAALNNRRRRSHENVGLRGCVSMMQDMCARSKNQIEHAERLPWRLVSFGTRTLQFIWLVVM